MNETSENCRAPLLYQCKFNGNNRRRGERDLPNGPVVGSLPANAGGMVRSLVQEDPRCRRAAKPNPPVCHNPWSPHALGPLCCNCAPNKRSCCNKKPTHCNQEWPSLTATRESLHAATKTECSQDKWINKKKRKRKEKKKNIQEIWQTSS